MAALFGLAVIIIPFMPDNPDIEAAKLKLEQDKLDFEKLKFNVDEPKRAEELAKLKVERDKTVLDTQDLRIPYKERAAYKVAIFQGRATVIGALVALLTLLTLKPIYDAFEARQARAIAEQEATQAKEQKTQAVEKTKELQTALAALAIDKANLDGEVSAAQKELMSLQAQVTEARQTAAVASIEDILNGIDKHPDDDPRPELRKALDDSAELKSFREHYLNSLATNHDEPAIERFYLLSLLYELSRKKQDASSLVDQKNLRRDLLELTAEQDLLLNPTINIVWPSLNETFGAPMIGYYACENYDKVVNGNPLAGLDPSIAEMADFIKEHYTGTPTCYHTILESLVSKNNSVSSSDYSRGFAQIFMFRSMGISLSMRASDFSYQRSTFQSFNNLPPYITDNEKSVAVSVIKKHFPIFFDVLSYPNLRRLKTCSPAILKPLKNNEWLEDVQLTAYCPVDTWAH